VPLRSRSVGRHVGARCLRSRRSGHACTWARCGIWTSRGTVASTLHPADKVLCVSPGHRSAGWHVRMRCQHFPRSSRARAWAWRGGWTSPRMAASTVRRVSRVLCVPLRSRSVGRHVRARCQRSRRPRRARTRWWCGMGTSPRMAASTVHRTGKALCVSPGNRGVGWHVRARCQRSRHPRHACTCAWCGVWTSPRTIAGATPPTVRRLRRRSVGRHVRTRCQRSRHPSRARAQVWWGV